MAFFGPSLATTLLVGCAWYPLWRYTGGRSKPHGLRDAQIAGILHLWLNFDAIS